MDCYKSERLVRQGLIEFIKRSGIIIELAKTDRFLGWDNSRIVNYVSSLPFPYLLRFFDRELTWNAQPQGFTYWYKVQLRWVVCVHLVLTEIYGTKYLEREVVIDYLRNLVRRNIHPQYIDFDKLDWNIIDIFRNEIK